MALKITCIKNVKFKIIKIKTGCQYIENFHCCENPKVGRTNLRLGHMWPIGCRLDIAGLKVCSSLVNCLFRMILSYAIHSVITPQHAVGHS